MSWIDVIIGAATFLWRLAFPKKTPEEAAHDAGRAEAERDYAVKGLQEVQAATKAGQDQRARLADDPHRLRDETAVPGAARPWNPGAE